MARTLPFATPTTPRRLDRAVECAETTHGAVRAPELQCPSVAKAKLVKTKKRCCKSGPRCKRCPVVCKRLEKKGLAERLELRVYLVSAGVTKKQLKAARAR
jgi:hypothetical protein